MWDALAADPTGDYARERLGGVVAAVIALSGVVYFSLAARWGPVLLCLALTVASIQLARLSGTIMELQQR